MQTCETAAMHVNVMVDADRAVMLWLLQCITGSWLSAIVHAPTHATSHSSMCKNGSSKT